MDCPWKDKSCMKKYLCKLGLFFISVLIVSILIKIIGLILSIISHTPSLNTIIVIAYTVIVLSFFCCVCSKKTLNKQCCGDHNQHKQNDKNKDGVKADINNKTTSK